MSSEPKCDVDQVTNMQDMFRRASAFNQDLPKWNVDKVASTLDDHIFLMLTIIMYLICFLLC